MVAPLTSTASTNISRRIIVAEYPKSGGSWLVSMLSSLFELPARDIYVSGDKFLPGFDIRQHPWYAGGGSFTCDGDCVIKSHELPGSERHSGDARTIHLVRDGRDVVVSKYYFDKDFMRLNGIDGSFDKSFDEFLAQTAGEWSRYVGAWLANGAILCRYEDLLADAPRELDRLAVALGLEPENDPESAALAHTRENMRASFAHMFKHNTFVRKATAGDWKAHFTPHHKSRFKSIAGDTLVALAYERDLAW